MANPHKGEVSVGGKTLVFSANAMCEVEDKLKREWVDIALEIDSWRPQLKEGAEPTSADLIGMARKVKTSLLRTLIWGAMQEHHEGATLKDAGRLIDSLDPKEGGALGLVMRLFERASPDAPAAPANPPKPGQDGTGQPS
jgi:hypothetical protein